MIRVGINGLGRIGRVAFRELITSKEFNIVAINDLCSAEELAHLIKYDTTHGNFHVDDITFDDKYIIINGKKKIRVYNETDPKEIPWKKFNVDVVFECTGKFLTKELAYKHIESGAKKVILSAPAKDEVKTVVYGVNENILKKDDEIISASSCTTNCIVPVLKILNDNYSINKGSAITIHAITNDQVILDINHKKGIYSRRGRSACYNIIPTSTGSSKAVGLIIPELNGKIDVVSYRVPVQDGSLIDLTIELGQKVTAEEINELFKKNSNDVVKAIDDPVVSSDIIGTTHASLVDVELTKVIETPTGGMLKLVIWYDNEWGYTNQMIRLAKEMCK